jgi:hypothetical protein
VAVTSIGSLPITGAKTSVNSPGNIFVLSLSTSLIVSGPIIIMLVFTGVQVRFVRTRYIFMVDLPSQLQNLSLVAGGFKLNYVC